MHTQEEMGEGGRGHVFSVGECEPHMPRHLAHRNGGGGKGGTLTLTLFSAVVSTFLSCGFFFSPPFSPHRPPVSSPGHHKLPSVQETFLSLSLSLERQSERGAGAGGSGRAGEFVGLLMGTLRRYGGGNSVRQAVGPRMLHPQGCGQLQNPPRLPLFSPLPR